MANRENSPTRVKLFRAADKRKQQENRVGEQTMQFSGEDFTTTSPTNQKKP
jgi:hypothetical protein